MTADATPPVTYAEAVDDLEEFLAGQMRDPLFRLEWYRLMFCSPHRLCIDGHAYARRRKARTRRKR